MPTGVYTRTDKTKEKLSESKKGKKNPFYGKHHTKERKRVESLSKTGKKNPMYGKHHTKKSKKKMRLAAEKLWTNPEYRKNALKNLKQYKKY